MIQMYLKDELDLNVLTVTGRTLGENLEMIEKSDFFERGLGYLKTYGINPEDIIRKPEHSNKYGSLAVLDGNIAPDGSVVKFSAIKNPDMMHHIGPARVSILKKTASRPSLPARSTRVTFSLSVMKARRAPVCLKVS